MFIPTWLVDIQIQMILILCLRNPTVLLNCKSRLMTCVNLLYRMNYRPHKILILLKR